MRKLLPLILLAVLSAGCSTYQDRVEAVQNDPNLTNEEKLDKLFAMEERQRRLVEWGQRIGQGMGNGANAYADGVESARQQQQLDSIERSLRDMKFQQQQQEFQQRQLNNQRRIDEVMRQGYYKYR